MDKKISVRFFLVENKKNDKNKFSKALETIYAQQLQLRETDVDAVRLRLERLERKGHLFSGEFVRIQSENLPPKAISGKPVEKLGVRSIGHSSVFIYDEDRSVLAMQIGQNGITAGRIDLYIQDQLAVAGFGIWPMLSEQVWNKLANNRIRKMSVRAAMPENLAPVASEHTSAANAMRQMKAATHSSYVEFTVGMARGEEDIPFARARRWLKWFMKERDEGGASVTRVAAGIYNAETNESEMLSLIKAHMGDKKVLDLPDDDPDIAYTKKIQYVRSVYRAHIDEINNQIMV